MALVKTSHFKWIDGVLHQLFEPHANTPDETKKYLPVEGTPPAGAELEARVSALEAEIASMKAPAAAPAAKT